MSPIDPSWADVTEPIIVDSNTFHYARPICSSYNLDSIGNIGNRYALVPVGVIKGMLKKIDCIMIRVEDLEVSKKYYIEVFGLHHLWGRGNAVGLGFPESDTEIVLHTEKNVPSNIEVYYLVDDVESAIIELEKKDCKTVVGPFDISMGKCAVILDPFGIKLSILDMSKESRETN